MPAARNEIICATCGNIQSEACTNTADKAKPYTATQAD